MFEGFRLFSNPKHPNVTIGLKRMEMAIQGKKSLGKKTMGMIMVVKKPAQQEGGADQPATAPESKPEGEKKTKPESDGRSK